MTEPEHREFPLLFEYCSQAQIRSWKEIFDDAYALEQIAQAATAQGEEEAASELRELAEAYRGGVLEAIVYVIDVAKEDEAEKARVPVVRDLANEEEDDD